MDRSATSRPECATAMRAAGVPALHLLLPATAGQPGEPASVAAAGPTVPAMAVLRQSPHGGHAGRQPQTHPAADADFGNRSLVSETQLEPSSARPRDLPVPVAGRVDRAAQPSLEHRYYVCADEGRLPVIGRYHALVQSVRV